MKVNCKNKESILERCIHEKQGLCSLDEIDILPDLFRDKVLEKFKIEWNDIFYSSKKVKHV